MREIPTVCVCVSVCLFIPFILDVRLVDAPAGVTQEEGHTGFLHLPSAVLALIFVARMIQSFLSLVGLNPIFLYPRINRSPLLVGHVYLLHFFVRENPSSWDCTEIRTHVPTSGDFEATN